MSPLFAAGIDPFLIKAILVLVFFGLAGLGKLLTKLQGKPPARPMGNAPRPQQPVGPNAADEINEFLRRAAQARKAQSQPVRPQQARPAQPRPQQPRPQTRTAPTAAAPVQAEIVADAPVGAKLGGQVEKDLDTKEFTQRTSQLGSEVVRADRQIDERLHQVFDHYVSKLELLPGEAAAAPVPVGPAEIGAAVQSEAPATFLADLADFLTNPDSLCQAVVLNEIIHRPEERWQ